MSKATKPLGAIVTSKSSVGKDEFKTELLKKSDSPKTAKETIKLVLNLFLNLFS